MVINVGALKDGNTKLVQDEINALADACHNGKAHLKVIIENCLLTDDEKKLACELAVKAGADFVKTSTGMSTSGATVEDVRLMRSVVRPNIGVKAAGGIRTSKDALAMIDAGANRIGASASVAIVRELGRSKSAIFHTSRRSLALAADIIVPRTWVHKHSVGLRRAR